MKIKGPFIKRVEALLKEYVDESEHQDGKDYWKMFKTPDHAVKDFLLYSKIVTTDRIKGRKY